MNDATTVRLLKAAHKHGIPPIHYSVLAGLLSYANYQWRCHPGQRALAKLCSVNKDTVTASVKWLKEHGVIEIYPKSRALNVYEIRGIQKWSVRSGRTDEKCHLSGSTAQFAVRSGRTDEKRVFRVICPAGSDVNKDTPDGESVRQSSQEVGEPSASTIENRLAFG